LALDEIDVRIKRQTLVIIEDHLLWRETLIQNIKQTPEAQGIRIVEFGNNESATQYVQNNAEDIIAYIQDNVRPIDNNSSLVSVDAGFQFYDQVITQFTPWAKTIVCTAYESFENAAQFLEGSKGRVKYLPKLDREGNSCYEKIKTNLPWLLQKADMNTLDDATDVNGLPGQIVQAVSNPWEDICRFITKHPSYLHQMPSRKFEMLIAEIFRDHGWIVELTSQTRDGGYDIIALQYAHPLNLRVLVEAKRWSPKRPVGVSVVRSLYGLRAHESFSQVVLATSSYVSRPAKKAFERQIPWELDFLERDKILEWCCSYRAVQIAGDFPNQKMNMLF
jgi:hypothetical protein